MASILKVDTIQDQSGNNIINESGNVITIGASGDTITVPAGATVSGFTSAGIDDNATSTAITIDSSENVGIGTTSPNGILDVRLASDRGAIIEAGVSQPVFLRSYQGSGSTNLRNVGLKGNEVVFYTGATTGTSSSERMLMDSNGQMTLTGSTTSFDTTASRNGLQTYYETDTGIATVGSYSDAGSTTLSFHTSQAGGASSEKMRILNNGNVGIGTSTPTVPLEVNGAVKFNEASGVSSGTVIIDGTATGNPQLRFYQNGTAKAYLTYWDSSDTLALTDGSASGLHFSPSTQRVGIGTSSPATTLHVSGGTANTVSLIESTDAYAWLSMKDNSSANSYINSIGASGDNLQIISKDITFRTASAPNVSTGTYGTERMRIDSSGNVLVAQTATNQNVVGISLNSNGNITACRDGNISGLFNRKTSDGSIVSFRKDGTEIGTIGVESGSLSVRRPIGTNGLIQTFGQPTHGIVGAIGNTSVDFYITNNSSGSNNAGLKLSNSNKIVPMENASNSDNVTDLGGSSQRFKDIYLGGGLYVGGTGTANKLDDYEEGTWTPGVSSVTNGMSVDSSTVATYTKVGNICQVQARIVFTGGSGNTSLVITGLPFNAHNPSGDGAQSTPTPYLENTATALTNPFFLIPDNATSLTPRVSANTGVGHISNWSNTNTNIIFSFTYRTT